MSASPTVFKTHSPNGAAPVHEANAQTAGRAVPENEKRLVTIRAALIGLLGVLLIGLLTPYNNYVVDQAGVVGNSLSIGAVCFCVLLVGVVNAVLLRVVPRMALQQTEIAVALGMVLVGCAIPGVGLFRYLPGQLVAPYYWSAQQPEYAELMRSMHLPDWLFPTFSHIDPAARGSEHVVQYFYGRVPPTAANRFLDRVAGVPWAAWARPAMAWGIFILFTLIAVLCITVIFRKQWVENERLPFPLATVYGSLIEQPEAGYSFNRLFRSRGFRVAATAVFFVQILNGLNLYISDVPAVPMRYNITGILADSPFWSQAGWYVKEQQIYFTVIGVAFFLRINVVMSLVFFCLASSVMQMTMKSAGATFTLDMQQDQQLGSAMVMLGATLWVARRHLQAVGRQMIGRGRAGDVRGFYLPYALAGWGVAGAAAGMTAWLVAASASVGSAIMLVAMLLGVMLLVGRVVAETGILYVLIATPLSQPMLYGAQLVQSSPLRTTLNSFYIARLMSNLFVADTRESLPNFATTALRLTDQSAGRQNQFRKSAMVYVGLLLLTLAVSYFVSGASTLYCFYNYGATLGTPPSAPLQSYSTTFLPQVALDAAQRFSSATATTGAPSHWQMFSSGAGITLLLSLLSLRFAAWPLAPVGMLLSSSWGLQMTWFSLLLGMITKKLLIRLGGSKLIQSAQPFFIGLIVGEVAAVAFWMIVALVLSEFGCQYQIVQLLPI